MSEQSTKDGLTVTAQTFVPDRQIGKGLRLYGFLSDTAGLYNLVKRTLLKDTLSTGKAPLSFKNDYLKRFGITARQFNAVRYDLGGILECARAVQKLHIKETTERIKSVNRWLTSKAACIRKIRKNNGLPLNEKNARIHCMRIKIHNKKRTLYVLTEKLSALKKDMKEGKARICFGSKALFHKQFNLHGNDYALHEEWLEDWRETRASTFMMLGSKDETGGNQTCTLRPGKDEGIMVARLRIADWLVSKYGKYVTIDG